MGSGKEVAAVGCCMQDGVEHTHQPATAREVVGSKMVAGGHPFAVHGTVEHGDLPEDSYCCSHHLHFYYPEN